MYTKKCAKFCEVCAHFSLASWYYINRKNPPIHYIVFATPHKKKYLLQKRQPNQLSFLLSKNKRRITEKTDIYACGMEKIKIIYLKHGTKNGMRKIECYMKAWRLQRRCGIYSI